MLFRGFCLLFLLVSGAATSLDIDSNALTQTGSSLRKKFFFKVYEVSHYMEFPPLKERALEEILQDGGVKQLRLQWLRSVPGHKIVEGFQETLSAVLQGEEAQRYAPEVAHFLSFFEGDAAQGDRHTLWWLPGGTLVVEKNGFYLGEITDVGFAQAVWKVWLGPKSVVQSQEMIRFLKS